MKSKKLQIKLPKLPKEKKSPIYRAYLLGKMLIFKLPISYLSYLNQKIKFQVSSVSLGKCRVSSITPINTGFGKIGKIFWQKQFKYFFLMFCFFLFSCKNSYHLSRLDRQDLAKYPSHILIISGKKHIVKARNLEITDSLQVDFQNDLATEYQEEMNDLRDND